MSRSSFFLLILNHISHTDVQRERERERERWFTLCFETGEVESRINTKKYSDRLVGEV